MEWMDRFTAVMDSVSEGGMDGLGVTEIARKTGLTKGTLHRMLKSMVEHRLIVQDPRTRKYRLGPKSMQWGSRFLVGQDPSGLLSDYCDLLAERTDLYTYLCRFDSGEVYCIYTRQPSTSRNKYFVHVGQRMPLHCSAAAKAILAFQPPSVVNALLLKEKPVKYTEFTKTDIQGRITELNEVFKSRIAFCEEELEVGVTAMSTPIFHGKREALLSISLIGSTSYINSHRELLINELLQIGEKASEHIASAHLLTSTRGGRVWDGSM
ncbi:IclR family transcriptional regulator [Collibacillus ludicampi]|uniref:IclR family transcriptional regulator n=1 Tax=Collibacillus ludicampi TaxID=2771369 RepID=UPI002494757E|nr:IclR family transcriptional regulator [Collibacillus ludicampi]